jgi:hypothetical protein
MGGLRVGVGAPIHYTAPAFDPRYAGYWRVIWRAPSWPATLPAPGWPLAEGEAGWLTTETVAFLTEIRAELEIHEAWLWASARALDRLQARLRDGLYRLKVEEAPGAAGALKLLKSTYKAGIGSWSIRENRTLNRIEPTHRPHWRHAIIGRSTALLLRDLAQAGAHPVAIATDGLAFLTDQLPEDLGLKIGLKLGQYSPEKSFPAAPMLDALDALAAAEAAGKPLGRAQGRVTRLITGKGDA